MKAINSLLFAATLAGFVACQNQPVPPPPAPSPQADTTGTDEDENIELLSVTRSGGSAVVPDPRTTTWTVEMRSDGGLMPVYLTQVEDGGGQKRTETSFALTTESAVAAIGLLQKVAAIKEKEFHSKAGKMVGSSGKTYAVGKNGKESNKIEVNLGATPPAAITDLENLVADELEAWAAAKAGSAGKTEKFLEGKVWQSDSDPNRRISFRAGRFVTFNKEGEEPGKPYSSFRQWCPDGCGKMSKKSVGEGMKAGYICCVTLFAQDDECYLVLEAAGKKFEWIGTGDSSKAESFTLLVRK